MRMISNGRASQSCSFRLQPLSTRVIIGKIQDLTSAAASTLAVGWQGKLLLIAENRVSHQSTSLVFISVADNMSYEPVPDVEQGDQGPLLPSSDQLIKVARERYPEAGTEIEAEFLGRLDQTESIRTSFNRPTVGFG